MLVTLNIETDAMHSPGHLARARLCDYRKSTSGFDDDGGKTVHLAGMTLVETSISSFISLTSSRGN